MTLCCFALFFVDASGTRGGDIPGEKIQRAYEDIKDIRGSLFKRAISGT